MCLVLRAKNCEKIKKYFKLLLSNSLINLKFLFKYYLYVSLYYFMYYFLLSMYSNVEKCNYIYVHFVPKWL